MSLKDFVILSKLGEGAYSSVYKVQRIADSQIYALKKVKMANLSEKQQQNALNEVRILASVKNPYIIGYKQAFIQSNSLCIVMEFSDDGDLYQKIVQNQKQETFFDENMIWKTLIQITIGLKKLHSLDILHRDLKSANVFLSKTEGAKLGDMNVSKIAKNGLLYTQTGTPYYASPQVWKDKPYDSKSDIWSLGCVIYEMTTLKPPFRAQDMDGLYKKVIKGSYTKIGDNYSKQLSGVIKMMLQVNPANRPDADQLLNNLTWKAEQLEIVLESGQKKEELLKTIRVHKNLHYLTERLPKSNYQNGYQVEKNQKMSVKKNSHSVVSNSIRGINLPALDRIIVKNNSNKLPILASQERRPYQIDHKNLEAMLKIQGRSQGRSQNQYEQRKGAERDIKAELRKIYNLRSSPKKQVRRRIELPRIK